MKKTIALLLAFALLFTLAACGKKTQAPADGDPVQSQEPTPPDVTPADPDPDPDPEPAEPAPLLPDPEQEETGDDPIADVGESGGAVSKDISISHKDVTLFSAGETFTLSEQGVQGVYACTFTSADPAVAEVDEQTGVVTAVAPGMTKVTAHIECSEGTFDFDCIVRCSWKAEDPSLPVSGTEDGGESGGTPAVPAQPSGSSAPSLSDFYASLQGQYEGLGAMMVMDGDLLENYYPGLSGIAAVEEVLIQETMISTANVAVGLVKLSDDASKEDILRVQSVLQGRITAQADGGAWYPESCETWEQGVITSTSNVVGMFVYPDEAQSMADLFTDSFSN